MTDDAVSSHVHLLKGRAKPPSGRAALLEFMLYSEVIACGSHIVHVKQCVLDNGIISSQCLSQ